MSKFDSKFVHQMVLNGDKTYFPLERVKDDSGLNELTIWQHIDLGDEGALEWLEQESGLEHAAITALTVDETRPRSFKGKRGVLIALRGVNTNPGHDPEDMVAIRVWIEEKRIVSVRRRPMMSIQDIVDDLEDGEGPRNPGEFLVELVNKLANRIGDFVEKLDEELSESEDSIESIEPSELRAALGSLRRQIATVRRYLTPQRDALDRLNYLETDLFGEKDRIRLREESDRVSRYLEDLDLARERAIVLHEAFISQMAQQQNSRMYALSIITAVFLPLGFITGLLGINVGGMPGAESHSAFYLVSGILMLIAIIIVVIFRQLKWL